MYEKHKRIGQHGEHKPTETVTGKKLLNNVAYSKRGIGGGFYVYLDIGKSPTQDKEIETLIAEVKPHLAKPKVAKKAKTSETE